MNLQSGPWSALANAIRLISALNSWVGRAFAWLALAIVLVCFTVVVLRYAFATSYVWMQDLYVWLNGAMFTAVAGYALLKDKHVRVDVFYRPASISTKAVIDLIGVVLFLLPFCATISYYAWRYVARSWHLFEGSQNYGGMPGLFVLKSFIVVFALLLALQGVAIAMRSILVLMHREAILPPELRYREGAE